MICIDTTSLSHRPLATSPGDIANAYLLDVLADQLKGIRFANTSNYSVSCSGEISPLLMGCKVTQLSGGYQLTPELRIRTDSLALLSPETDMLTSALTCLGSWTSLIGDLDGSPGTSAVGFLLTSLAVIIMFGASVVKTVCAVSNIFKVNGCIRALTKQVKEQRQALLTMSQQPYSTNQEAELERSYQQVSESLSWQANVDTLRAFQHYRSILITNLVEKTLFFMLITSVICFITLALVLGVASLSAVVMGGCAAGLGTLMLIFGLISHFFSKKHVQGCVCNVQSAWLNIMTSKLITNMPQELRQNATARLVLLKSFIKERSNPFGKRAFSSADLAITMAKIGYPVQAATYDGQNVDGDLMVNSLLNAKDYFG